MQETAADLTRLNRLIRHSNASSGKFLRSSFEIPSKSLSAEQLAHRLDGVATIAFGTVSSDGKPRVAPVVAIFYRADFYIPTVRDSLRARHMRNNPEVSLSLYEGIDFAVIVHGRASVVAPEDDVFSELIEIQVIRSGGDVREWGDAMFLRVDAERLYSFARYPEQFPGTPLTEIQTIR